MIEFPQDYWKKRKPVETAYADLAQEATHIPENKIREKVNYILQNKLDGVACFRKGGVLKRAAMRIWKFPPNAAAYPDDALRERLKIQDDMTALGGEFTNDDFLNR